MCVRGGGGGVGRGCMYSNISSLYPLNARSTPIPSYDYYKQLQTSLNVPRLLGDKIAPG